MNNNWINSSNYAFFENISTMSSANLNKYKNIVIFDLDGTLIKTKSGKTFPTNKNDWIFNYDNVVSVMNNLENTIIGIISNQKGLKSDGQIKDWQEKINDICNSINFHFVFASFKDDRYRKPMISSWDFIKEKFKNLNIPNSNITYVGDAAGREGDHNDTDLKFSLNCGFKFKTPEKFFGSKIPKQAITITYPELTYYTKTELNNIIKKITNKFKENEKVLVVMIGFPGCGKSYLRKLFINEFNNFKYYNKDDIKNKVISNNLISKHNTNIDFIIDDNTNTNLKSRNELYKIYETHYKIGIYFNYEIELAMHLNYIRMYWYGAELVKKVAYYTLNKKFDVPDNKEFDLLIQLDKIIPDFETSMKYYF